MSRLPEGGMIDRKRPLSFSFNGRRLSGFQGDSLASALLANDIRLVGRSFKYHRPRGIVSAGGEEPNALVTLGGAADQGTPNLRATEVELSDGLAARSQNHGGGPLWFDPMAINDLLSPFLGAGFYYKTFMWPASFWERVYEPLIRRAAGLGALSGEPDEDRHDKAWAHCDLLVIGAGPAGLMAALRAGRAGHDVILADEDFAPGGALLFAQERIDGKPARDWLHETLAELASLPNLRIWSRTAVLGAYDGGTYGAWQRHGEGAVASTFWRIVARRAVLATGGHERLIAFPNNDRPGIMQAGAVQEYIGRYGVAPGRRIVLFTNNDNGLRLAGACISAGVALGAVVDLREDAELAFNCPTFAGGRIVDTRGRLGLSGVKIRAANGETRWVEADCLAVSGGWNPAVHLACHLGAKPSWNAPLAAFCATDGMVPGMVVAGVAAGRCSTQGALQSGAEAAARALDLDGAGHVPNADDAPVRLRPFWHVDAPGRAWLDFQNDVTVKDVKQAHQENFRSIEHMKRYTTLGMGTDQGKTGNVAGLAIMAELTGASIPETGTTTFRPPYTPVPIAAMGAGGAGKGFAPERLTPSHDASLALGAPMIEAGHWYRPSYFPLPTETHWRQSCDREVGLVRANVGICDVSTLGKIDVQGPDAERFIDFVYTGKMSSLAPGKLRYGLMLREDGFVMDDGTCARIGPGHFLLTTTTAAAGPVMAHLEFVQQCLVPDWDVHLVSVSDNWAQFAIAGPKSRELLKRLFAEDLSDENLPYMGWIPVTLGGVAGRLFRISFSGERAFELAMPARYGASLFALLRREAEALDGGAYGMEALNVLRIEKGFVTHAEIHGRVTARDLGLGHMLSGQKDFIGRSMAGRPHLTSDDREQMVGLKPVGAVQKLLAGSHIIGEGAAAVSEEDQGYVTTVCHSPTLGHMIGLGFLRNGRARLGERVRCVDLLRDFDTLCEVVHPVFVDPDGEKLRG